MAGVLKINFKILNFKFLMIINRLPLTHCLPDIFLVIKNLFVIPLSFFFQNSQAVYQHNFSQILGRRSGINSSPKTLFDQLRNAANVVNMTMRYKKSVNAFGVIIKRRAILILGNLRTLKKSAVNEQFCCLPRAYRGVALQ